MTFDVKYVQSTPCNDRMHWRRSTRRNHSQGPADGKNVYYIKVQESGSLFVRHARSEELSDFSLYPIRHVEFVFNLPEDKSEES